MRLSMRLLVVLTAAACLSTLVSGASDVRRKQQRPTRGFKNVEMMTARGFGKRDRPTRAERDVSEVESQSASERASRGTPTFKSPSVGIARDFGKRTSEPGEAYGLENFWETLEASPERQSFDGEDRTVESIPLDWFVNEVLNNPTFARSVVRKFVDLNQDGVLSSDELLRNVI